MKFTFSRSPIGKLHTPLALFVFFNLISGYINLFVHFIPVLAKIHFFTGIFIIVVPLLMLFTMKDPMKILKAFLRMIFSFKSDLNKKRYMLGFAKLSAFLGFIIILLSAITGIMLKFNLFSFKAAYAIHTTDFKLLLILIPIHGITMFILNISKSK